MLLDTSADEILSVLTEKNFFQSYAMCRGKNHLISYEGWEQLEGEKVTAAAYSSLQCSTHNCLQKVGGWPHRQQLAAALNGSCIFQTAMNEARALM